MQRTENKARARVSEIFTSIEGEGIFVGKKTLFIRFSGCHLKCRWCDTKYALPLDSGTDYQIDEIKDLIIKELQPFTYKVNFTGGEPLLQTEDVIELADFIKKQTNLKTYMESSCFDSELFSKVLPYIESFKNLVYNISKKIKPSDILGLIIQPSFGIDQPTVNKLLDTYDIVQPMFPEVRIIPQLHKEIGAK